MFLALAPLLWYADMSLTADQAPPRLWQLPVVVKLVFVFLLWAFIHHLIAGARHLWIDINHSASDRRGRSLPAAFIIAFPVLISALAAAHLFFYE